MSPARPSRRAFRAKWSCRLPPARCFLAPNGISGPTIASHAEEAPTIAQRVTYRQLLGEKAPLREAMEARVDARFWRNARPWRRSIFVGAGLGGRQSIEDAGDDVRGVDRFAVLLVAALRDSAFGVNGIAFLDF